MSLPTSKATIVLIAGAVFAVSLGGCKTIGFKKPELPSLAFWKKDQGDDLPPPPARHFDPARFDSGESESQVAASRDEFDQYGLKRKVDDASSTPAGSDTRTELATSRTTGSATRSDGSQTRKPYGMDDFAGQADDKLKQASNEFQLNTDGLKDRFDNGVQSLNDQTNNAQQQFAAAMKSKVNDFDNSFASGNKSFQADDNSFVGTPVKPSAGSGTKSAGGNEFGSDAFGSGSKSLTDAVSAAEAKVDKSLYGLDGKLHTAAKDIASASGNVKSEFERRIEAAQTNVKAQASNATNQFSALANSSASPLDVVKKPLDQIASKTSIGSRPAFGSNSFQPTLQPGQNSGSGNAFQLSKPSQLSNATQLGGESVAAIKSEVEEARRQIELLKQQVAAARASAAGQVKQRLDDGRQVVKQSVNGLAQQASNAFSTAADGVQKSAAGISLPGASAGGFDTGPTPRVARQSNQFGGGNQFVPSNQFAPSSTSPIAQPNLQPQPKSTSPGGTFYPATPYGGFGANQKNNRSNNNSPAASFAGSGSNVLQPLAKPTEIGQASFSPTASGQRQSVSQAVAEVDRPSPPDGIHRANAIQTNVQIPAAVLTGNSNFSPGSTIPLRK